MFPGSKAALMDEGFASLPEAPAEDPLAPLIQRILGGEVDAFEDLMARTEARVLALAWRMLGDRHLAEDAAQETYLRVFRSLHTFRLGERFEAWLVRIAVNVCRDLARKRGPLPVPLDAMDTLPGDPAAADAEETALLYQRRALVHRALESLPQAERAALVLRDLEGLSTEEAARILGVRPVTIRSQAASARAKVQAFCARLLHPHGGRP
ncbi:MAG: RNA polymerase sigma factor [Geothrix sp.]|uniref:RNA polymerase sigma factor n=1 Tax=Geothrix sp. TaxID=1962974 RepID=UPI0017A9C6EF|nr:RNA polymerase sigma factor [Geothrix sp.]NWJ40202.1 RNA polymerase sigma factor [Geothrix sp.]WIL21790.1 MAG: RNA polymerase sigma factor [Geothrix sp.]